LPISKPAFFFDLQLAHLNIVMNQLRSVSTVADINGKRKILIHDFLFKIMIIGDSTVGKSCIMTRFAKDTYRDNFIMTIGVDFQIRVVNLLDEIIKIQIWDTAGQERFRTITESYYRGAHGILVVYDTTDMRSFDSIQRWLQDIKKYASEDVQIILIGNKCDLIENRQISYDQGKEFANNIHINFFETSAKNSINIEEAFMTMIKQIRANYKSKSTTGFEVTSSISSSSSNISNSNKTSWSWLSWC